jgi:hypothetical protein
VQGLIDPNLRYPYALSVTLIVGFMVLLAVVFYRDWRSWRPPTKAALSYGILCYAVYLVVTSSHFLADPLHPSVSRLFMLPAVLLTALAIPGALVVKGKYQFLFLMCGVASLLFAQPISMDKKQTRTLTLIRLTESLYRFLDDYADARSVIVVDRPGQYTLRPISAVSPEWMNANVDRLVNGVKSGLYSKVLVVQEQRGDDPALVPSLDARFNLDPIHRFQNDSRTNYIISQLRVD